jgi:hypothetical protein
MALNARTSVASRNLSLDAALDVLNSGSIALYDGTQPTDPDTAVSTQTKLAQCSLSATAFAAATGGSKTANAVASDAAIASGTAAWFRLYKSDGTTAVHDGTVGTLGCNCNMNSVAISSGATVSITSIVISEISG